MKRAIFWPMALIALWLAAMASLAQQRPAASLPKVLSSDKGDGNNGTVGDPISTAVGELYEKLPPDLDLGGPLPPRFQRYYASYLKSDSITSALGNNWVHNFDVKLAVSAGRARVVFFGATAKFAQVGGNWQLSDARAYRYQLANVAEGFQFLDPETEIGRAHV